MSGGPEGYSIGHIIYLEVHFFFKMSSLEPRTTRL